jgi:hypothetical protein
VEEGQDLPTAKGEAMPSTSHTCADCHCSLQGKAVYCIACYGKRLMLCNVCCEEVVEGKVKTKGAYRKHCHIGGPEKSCRVCGGKHPGESVRPVCPTCHNERWVLDTAPREGKS